jgi:uncharacterized LabA/DUF88 family protein
MGAAVQDLLGGLKRSGMANFLYVDNSNVWIEGMHVAAVANGIAPNLHSAQNHNICDHSWKLDFGRLLEFAGGDRADLGRAVLYGSRPPPNDSLWKSAERKGFEVVVHDRNLRGKEKKIDTNIATDIVADSYELMNPERDEITLVAGDSDYVPTVERLKRRGLRFYVVFWQHAARELREVCTQFVPLNPHLELLRVK